MSDYPYRHYFDEEGHHRVERDRNDLRCDFCIEKIDVTTVWTYPTAPMPIVGPKGKVIDASDDDWAVCPTCHRLIQRSAIGELVERMVTLQPPNAPEAAYFPPLPVARRYARENVLRFMDARKGQPNQGPPW